MSERKARDSLDEFCRCVVTIYGPRMLGSLYCLHWVWGSCPNAWQEQFTWGDTTVILEAVASLDLWIWHAFFGAPGSNNDINVLDMSLIFNGFCDGSAPNCPFQVNGTMYDCGYYLADGIYPEFVVFVKTLTCPGDPKRIKYKTFQEKARKDVERAFGVLKKRWRILQHLASPRTIEKFARIMYACIILHNMILEDEHKIICQYQANDNVFSSAPIQASSHTWRARRRDEFRNDLAKHIYRVNEIDLNELIDNDIGEYSNRKILCSLD